MLHIKEEYTENPNKKVEELMDDFAKYLDDKDIQVDYVDYSSKTIYVETIKDLKEARYELRTEFAELKQLGVHILSSIGTDGVNKDYIVNTKTQTESLDNDFESYTFVKSKTVYDSDGWTTEYTMYYDEVNDRYVFVLGDSDYYNPNDGYEEFDWECDSEREANDWFNNYNGFEDDLDESLKEDVSDLSTNELVNSIKDMLSKIKFINVDLDKSIFDESGTDTYYLVLDKVFSAFNGSIHTETNYPIEISNTPILFKENNRGTVTMLFINAGKEWKITKNGKTSVESVNPYSKKDTLLYIYNQLKKLVPDMKESYNIKEASTASYWKYNQFEDTLPEGDYYDKETIKRFRLIPCDTPEDCYEGDIRRFSAWAVTELEYPYKEVYCTKDEAYEYLMDYLNHGRYETIHDL